jgi:hypothetical protein
MDNLLGAGLMYFFSSPTLYFVGFVYLCALASIFAIIGFSRGVE